MPVPTKLFGIMLERKSRIKVKSGKISGQSESNPGNNSEWRCYFNQRAVFNGSVEILVDA
jgi:hypothetical protein